MNEWICCCFFVTSQHISMYFCLKVQAISFLVQTWMCFIWFGLQTLFYSLLFELWTFREYHICCRSLKWNLSRTYQEPFKKGNTVWHYWIIMITIVTWPWTKKNPQKLKMISHLRSSPGLALHPSTYSFLSLSDVCLLASYSPVHLLAFISLCVYSISSLVLMWLQSKYWIFFCNSESCSFFPVIFLLHRILCVCPLNWYLLFLSTPPWHEEY